LRLVGVGPQRNFTLRRWWHPVAPAAAIAGAPITPVEHFAPWSALRESLALWRERSALADALVSGDAIRAAAPVYGCDLWPVLQHELRGAAQVQWPWSARAMDEAGAAIDALQCQTVITYAEAGGWGRALMLEARRRGVPSVGVQHGFIYRHWLNYLHEVDEMQPIGTDRGFPAPDKTLLFDRYAEAHLRSAGAFPAGRLAVTGSPARDALATRMASLTPAERDLARLGAGVVRHKQKLAVLAAKFTEIQDALPALVGAIRAEPEIHLAIKPHPAESSAVYAPFVTGLTNVTTLGADADLAGLLGAADVLVTRNSTVAIDALVLGVPALVIGQPSNLSPFVDEGVMLGADDEAGINQVLHRLLYDPEVQARLGAATEAFVEAYDLKARGTAALRAAGAILEMKPR
jgi:surface carbohydrate biosynthesis protein (TIGR04326 family)